MADAYETWKFVEQIHDALRLGDPEGQRPKSPSSESMGLMPPGVGEPNGD